MKQQWYEVKIKIHPLAVDAITEFLISKGAFGVAIQDEFEFNQILQQEENKFLQDKLDDSNFSLTSISAYYPESEQGISLMPRLKEDDNPYFEIDQELYNFTKVVWVNKEELAEIINDKIKEISEYLEVGEYSLKLTLIAEEDWANDWKKYYKPIEVNDKLVICPTWEKFPLKQNQVLIKLDPGSAFGTGSHETTNLCLDTLTQQDLVGKKVLDVGCGSGILSIASEKFGAESVIGLDLDPQAIKVSEANKELNLCKNINFYVGSTELLADYFSKNPKFEVVVANILAEILVNLKNDLKSALSSNGILILSGIIKPKLAMVKEAFSDDFVLVKETEKNDWLCLVYKKY